MEFALLKIYSRLVFPNKLLGIINRQQAFAAAKPLPRGRGASLPPDQEVSYVEEDAAKLCKNVCVNYKLEGFIFDFIFSLYFWEF